MRLDTAVLFDDVRSLASFEYFGSRGYRTLRIDAPESVRLERMMSRDGYLPARETFEHPSETELDGVAHEFVIDNASNDLDLLYGSLDRLVETLRGA